MGNQLCYTIFLLKPIFSTGRIHLTILVPYHSSLLNAERLLPLKFVFLVGYMWNLTLFCARVISEVSNQLWTVMTHTVYSGNKIVFKTGNDGSGKDSVRSLKLKEKTWPPM